MISVMKNGWLAAFAILASQGAAAAAQQNPVATSAQHRADCRLAHQVLTSGHPANKREWAEGYIRSCPAEAPAWLVRQWGEVEADTDRVTRLVWLSSELRDARLYSAAREVILDVGRADVVRAGAMLLLARYVNPGNAMTLESLRPPPGEVVGIPSSTDSNTGSSQGPGSEPLGDVGAQVVALLDDLAQHRDSHPKAVWYAAAVISQRIHREMENGVAR